MDSKPRQNRRLEAGGIISTVYLLLFGMFEAYSAVATALDTHSQFPSWEPKLGWAMLALPCVLIGSLFILRGRLSKIGLSLVITNLCFYAGFMIFETMADHGQSASSGAVWEIVGIWSSLFVVALLATYVLRSGA